MTAALNLIVVCCVFRLLCFVIFYFRSVISCSARARQMTQLVGELHPDSYLYLYLSFFVHSTNNAKDCKHVWWYTILLFPARWSWRSNKSHEISFIGWNSRMPRIFFFYAKQGKLGSSIQPTNVLKPEPIHATFSINMFVGILLRDSARDFSVESLRHHEIFEIRARGQKTIGSHLKT